MRVLLCLGVCDGEGWMDGGERKRERKRERDNINVAKENLKVFEISSPEAFKKVL